VRHHSGLGPIAVTALLAISGASFPLPAFSQAQDLDDYIGAQLESGGLTEMTHDACVGGCPRHGYNGNETPGRADLHGTTEYLKRLRDFAVAYPTAVLPHHSFGLTLEELLYQQIQMFLRDPG
jgi:hypothetical protein